MRDDLTIQDRQFLERIAKDPKQFEDKLFIWQEEPGGGRVEITIFDPTRTWAEVSNDPAWDDEHRSVTWVYDNGEFTAIGEIVGSPGLFESSHITGIEPQFVNEEARLAAAQLYINQETRHAAQYYARVTGLDKDDIDIEPPVYDGGALPNYDEILKNIDTQIPVNPLRDEVLHELQTRMPNSQFDFHLDTADDYTNGYGFVAMAGPGNGIVVELTDGQHSFKAHTFTDDGYFFMGEKRHETLAGALEEFDYTRAYGRPPVVEPMGVQASEVGDVAEKEETYGQRIKSFIKAMGPASLSNVTAQGVQSAPSATRPRSGQRGRGSERTR